MEEGRGDPGPAPKVARAIERYDLEGVGDELERRWTRPDERQSLRRLADWFNERLLRAALEDASVDTIAEDVSHLYAVLAGETGSPGERTQVERRLERAGVDVASLSDAFVSYGAIRTYLVDHRNASPPSTGDDEDEEDRAAATIDALRNRTASVTESKLSRLRDADRLRVGSHRVLVDVQVLCEECGKQYEVTGLLESGACDCFTD